MSKPSPSVPRRSPAPTHFAHPEHDLFAPAREHSPQPSPKASPGAFLLAPDVEPSRPSGISALRPSTEGRSPAKNLLVEFVSTPRRKSNAPGSHAGSPATLLWATQTPKLPVNPTVVEDLFYVSPTKRTASKPKRAFENETDSATDDTFGSQPTSIARNKIKKQKFDDDLFPPLPMRAVTNAPALSDGKDTVALKLDHDMW